MNKLFIPLLFLILVANTLYAAPAICLSNANVREKPSAQSKRVAWVKKNDTENVEYLVENAKGQKWAKITKGFILLKLLKISKEHKIKTIKAIKYLTKEELESLFIGNIRIGKTRYSKNGSFFKSRFNKDGSVYTSLYSRNGEQISDYRKGRWSFHENGSFCVSESIKKSKVSCRRVMKNKDSYISILESDGKIFAKFMVK